MLGVGGWKTIVGVLFLALTTVLPELQEMMNPIAYQWLSIICKFVGVVLTGLGIGHKIEKIGRRE